MPGITRSKKYIMTDGIYNDRYLMRPVRTQIVLYIVSTPIVECKNYPQVYFKRDFPRSDAFLAEKVLG